MYGRRSIFSKIVGLIVFIVFVTFGFNMFFNNKKLNVNEYDNMIEVKQLEERIENGEEPYEVIKSVIADADFKTGTFKRNLKKSDGKYVNFLVKNTGKIDVRIEINDSDIIVIKPGEEGAIMKGFSSDEQDFTFRVVPTPNGKDVKIEHSIYQKSYIENEYEIENSNEQ